MRRALVTVALLIAAARVEAVAGWILLESIDGTDCAGWAVVQMDPAADYAVCSAIPDCDDSAGKHLNRDVTTGAWSCGTTTSGAPATHALLSATHSDTSAAAPIRGYLVRGNATPAWERFACATTRTVPMGDGSDVACEVIDLGTDTDGNFAGGDSEGGNALTGDSATAFFGAGAIEAARGGTAIDTSGSTGVPRITAGTWSADAGVSHLAASTSAALAGVLSDESGSGAAIFGTTPTIATPIVTLEQSAAPADTTEGRIQWDTDDNRLVVGDGAATKTFYPGVSGDAVAVTFQGLSTAIGAGITPSTTWTAVTLSYVYSGNQSTNQELCFIWSTVSGCGNGEYRLRNLTAGNDALEGSRAVDFTLQPECDTAAWTNAPSADDRLRMEMRFSSVCAGQIVISGVSLEMLR